MASRQITRRGFLKATGFCAAAWGLRAASVFAQPAGAGPNVVFILADDLGYGDPACYSGKTKVPTPAMDRLASQGIRFTDAHTPSAVCTPTRYGILTGRYCWRSSLKKGVLNGYSEPLIETDRETIASLFKRHGYNTGCVGKWHLGLGWATKEAGEKVKADTIDWLKPTTHGPQSLGFDYSCIIPASLDMDPYCWLENGRVVEPATSQTPGSKRRWDGGGGFWRAGPMAPSFDFYEVLPAMLDPELGEPIREATIHHSINGLFAIRQGPWKLIQGLGSGGFTAPQQVEPTPGGPKGQLYNLQDDPDEQKNLWLDQPEIVQRLTTLLERYKEQGYSRPM